MITYVVMTLIGLIVCLIAVYYSNKYKRLLKTGESAEGIIFDYEISSNDGVSTQYPIVRYVTRQQQWVTKKAEVSITSFSSFLKKGSKVTVFYDPANPEEFVIYHKLIQVIIIITFIIGMIVIALGIILILNQQNIIHLSFITNNNS